MMSRFTVLEIKANLSNLQNKTVIIKELLLILYPFNPTFGELPCLAEMGHGAS